MKKILNDSMFKYGWWFIFNLLVTLFIVSLMGVGGGRGKDGLDGQDGVYIRNMLEQTYEVKPTGASRAAYAQALVEEGYFAIDELADFETYFHTDFEGVANWLEYSVLTNRKYVLLNDIDFAEAEESHFIPARVSYEFSGVTDFGFDGIFDGAGFSILNYTRSSMDLNVGFIPSVNTAIIKNISFVNAEVQALSNEGDANVGVVVGDANGNIDFINVTVEDSIVISTGDAGGVVGNVEDTTRFINSHVIDSTIYGKWDGGGFIGRADYGDLLFAYSSNQNTEVNGLSNEFYDRSNNDYGMDAGGLVGEVDDQGWVYVYQTYNTGYIASKTNSAGGFFGNMDNINRLLIAQSYNNAYIESFSSRAGGLIGDINVDFTLHVQDSFNAGTIFSSDTGGGIIGRLERDNRHPEVEIINVYNSARILSNENTDEFGGIIGDVDSSLILNIRNSFNVGEFSNSLVENDDLFESNFPMNGSIIGEVEEALLTNVYFYVDLERLDNYLQTATDKQFDIGSAPIYDHDKFTSEDFILGQAWDFDGIWNFTEGYDYPTLTELTFTPMVQEETDYKPTIEVWVAQSVFLEVETGYSPVQLLLDYMDMGDVEDKAEELTFEILVSTTLYNEYEDGSLEGLLDDSTVMYSGLGYPTAGEPIGNFVPENSDTHYAYFLVTDTDGNQTFIQRHEFTPMLGGDTEAPTIVAGAFSASFGSNDPTIIDIAFTTGTDNVTPEDELSYFFVVSTSTEAFSSPETAYAALNDELYAFQLKFTPTIGLSENSFVDLVGFEFNVEYYASILVLDDADNPSLYAFVPIIVLD